MLQKIRYFLFLITVLVMIVVAFQNHHEVDIQILFFSGRYPLTLLLLVISALSFLLGSMWMVWRSRKRESSSSARDLKKPQAKKKIRSKRNPFQRHPSDAGND